MHLKNRFRSWLEGLSAGRWILFQSVIAVLAVSAGDVIVNELSKPHSWWTRAALAAALLVGAIAYFWIALAAARVRDRVFPKHPSTVLALQRELSDALTAENQLIADRRGRTKKERHAEGMAIFMRAVQRAISQQWTELRFGSATQTEVVLMTKSLRDGEMTCASWAVRRPYSLASRETDPTVYNETEAARMYRQAREQRVGSRVIADTAEPGSTYEFINESESERIRSTALHPVYDPESELIGVLVAHTNRPNVFRSEDLDFWTALLRLVEPHIARRIILARAEEWSRDPPW
jgi:GAF domain-containing protein